MRLKLSDISRVYFCTGARNHDLLSFFSPERITFEYDERMASFKALGLAKGMGTPVAVCTTSGTAVSECVSALLEAQYSEVPLILITGDRPKKMHGTGAPQTIDHEALTVGARGSFFEIPLAELKDLEISNPVYPVHINVLVDDTASHELPTQQGLTLADFSKFLKTVKRPLFLFSHESHSQREFIERFQKTNLPFYAETLSGARDLSLLKTEKRLVTLLRSGEVDGVVRIGHTPLSKAWRILEQKPLPVFSFDPRGLSALSHGKVMTAGARDLHSSQEFWNTIESISPFGFSDDSSSVLEDLLEKYPSSEPAVMRRLQNALPENSRIYLGNSLIIRFFELVQKKAFKTLGSRGVNGIDGQLATAIGIAESTTEEVICILGDITTKYDLTSIPEMPKNLKLIIINNLGGRIFDLLGLDKRIILEHEEDFSKIVPALGKTYSRSLSDLKTHQVIELMPEKLQTEAFLRDWA